MKDEYFDLDLEKALSRMKRHAENTKASFAEMLKVEYPDYGGYTQASGCGVDE